MCHNVKYYCTPNDFRTTMNLHIIGIRYRPLLEENLYVSYYMYFGFATKYTLPCGYPFVRGIQWPDWGVLFGGYFVIRTYQHFCFRKTHYLDID